MEKIALFVLALAAAIPVYAQSANPLTSGARFHYGIIKNYVIRAAAKMPEENYPFRPTPEVRTFAQLVGHLADSNYRICSVLVGSDPIDGGIERDKKSKPDLIKALDESFAYCDKVYADMTDEAGKPIVKFDAGGEGSRVPIQMPRLTVLAFHTAHAFEHYGNVVTYMRLKGLVPPSSEPPFGTYSPPSVRKNARQPTVCPTVFRRPRNVPPSGGESRWLVNEGSVSLCERRMPSQSVVKVIGANALPLDHRSSWTLRISMYTDAAPRLLDYTTAVAPVSSFMRKSE